MTPASFLGWSPANCLRKVSGQSLEWSPPTVLGMVARQFLGWSPSSLRKPSAPAEVHAEKPQSAARKRKRQKANQLQAATTGSNQQQSDTLPGYFTLGRRLAPPAWDLPGSSSNASPIKDSRGRLGLITQKAPVTAFRAPRLVQDRESSHGFTRILR